MYIPCNVSAAERTARTTMGAALLALGVSSNMKTSARIAIGLAGAVELVTGLTGYCPINQIIRRNTCAGAHKPHDFQLERRAAA